MPVRIIQLLLIACCIMAWSAHASAQARKCPANAHPDGEDAKNFYCTCNKGFEPMGNACVAIKPKPAAGPNLARDPVAACLSAAQLRLAESRIPNLQQAIAALSAPDSNWEREREHLLKERRHGWGSIALEGANVVLLVGAHGANFYTAKNVTDMGKVLTDAKATLGQIPAEVAHLNRILATTKDTKLAARILTYQGKLNQLSRLEAAHKSTERFVQLRDVGDAARGVYGMVDARPGEADALLPKSFTPPVPDRLNTIRDRLYMGSALLGGVAVAFVSTPLEIGAVAVGTVGFSAWLANRELKNIRQESERLATLDQEALKRGQMKLELTNRLNDLVQQRERLAGVVQRSGPATNCP